jgi:aminoglycoside phosphotransferase (APT) family kinase protein
MSGGREFTDTNNTEPVALKSSELPDLTADVQRIIQKFSLQPVFMVTRLSSGVMTYKYVIHCENDKWVLRFYPHARSHIVNFEPDLLRRCSEAGLAVPEVLGDSRNDPGAQLQYVLYRMLPGVSLAEYRGVLSSAEMHKLGQQVVKFLQSMARISVQGWGPLTDARHGQLESWEAFVAQTFENGIAAVQKNRLLNANRIQQLQRVRDNLSAFISPARAGIAWGDLSPGNIIVDEVGALRGFVDLEGALVAESILSLGYLRAYTSQSPLYQALAVAWSESLDVTACRRIDLYAVMRMLRIMEFATKPLPTGVKRVRVDSFLPGAIEALDAISGSNSRV